MKKEGESIGGGDLLNNCLSVQQLHMESAPQNHENQENMIRGPVTGPTTDLYSGTHLLFHIFSINEIFFESLFVFCGGSRTFL